MGKQLVHEIIKQSDILYHSSNLLDMEKLTNKMIKLIPVKSVHYQLTEMLPGAFLKIMLYGLHPKSSSTSEIYGG